MTISDIFAGLSVFLTLCFAIGGYIAYRRGYHKTTAEVEGRLVNMLQTEGEELRKKVEGCEKEITRLRQVIELVQESLLKKGIHVTIDGDTVTIEDAHQGKQSYTRASRRAKKPAEST